jgi:hypothetical protein
MQIKIPLEALFALQFRVFLQEEFKLGFFLAVENRLHKVGGVQVHSTISSHRKCHQTLPPDHFP